MSLDSTYSPPVPAAAETGEDNLNKQQPTENFSTTVVLTADTANTRQEQERGLTANKFSSGDASPTSGPTILPFLSIDGITPADTGNKDSRKPADARSNTVAQDNVNLLQPQDNQSGDRGLPQSRSEQRDTVADAKDSGKGGGEDRADNDDEPEAVKKYKQKHKPSPTGKDVTPDPSPDKPSEPDSKPDAKLKPRYETSEMEEAIKYAKDNNLPLVLHIGTENCHWCKVMEKNSWPKIEKDGDVNKKAVYLHLDADQVEKMTGAAAEAGKKLLEGVESYPTIKVVNPSTLETKESNAGYMAPEKLKQFIQRNTRD
jgi:hypothetical protein